MASLLGYHDRCPTTSAGPIKQPQNSRMFHLQLTLPGPAENLALDQALLEAAEVGDLPGNVLRLWESPTYFVVLGRSSSVDIEVDRQACRAAGVPVYRRPSGGGTVLSGPGCLSYAVILDFASLPHLRAIDRAHQYVLETVADAVAPLVPGVQLAGTSDLVIANGDELAKKFSGNALRIKRTHFLYHGTLLYDFSLELVQQLLATPTRTPDYRQDRDHHQFITNLPLDRAALETQLLEAWSAREPLHDWPRERTKELAASHYQDLND